MDTSATSLWAGVVVAPLAAAGIDPMTLCVAFFGVVFGIDRLPTMGKFTLFAVVVSSTVLAAVMAPVAASVISQWIGYKGAQYGMQLACAVFGGVLWRPFLPAIIDRGSKLIRGEK